MIRELTLLPSSPITRTKEGVSKYRCRIKSTLDGTSIELFDISDKRGLYLNPYCWRMKVLK